MSDYKVMQKCELCGKEYQHGPHRYEGHYSKLFDLRVCDICWKGNWDGWNPRYEGFLISHLKKKELPVPQKKTTKVGFREVKPYESKTVR